MPDAVTRWTVVVSKETDIAVRSFLTRRGFSDLSKFVEEAVRWRMLDQALAEARGTFAGVPTDALESLIDEAVSAARATPASEAG